MALAVLIFSKCFDSLFQRNYVWLISGALPVNQHPTPSATPVKPRLAKRADSQVPNLFAHPPAAEVKKIFIYFKKANTGD